MSQRSFRRLPSSEHNLLTELIYGVEQGRQPVLIAEAGYQRGTPQDTNAWNFVPKSDLKG